MAIEPTTTIYSTNNDKVICKYAAALNDILFGGR